jgi:hypothetical protein
MRPAKQARPDLPGHDAMRSESYCESIRRA